MSAFLRLHIAARQTMRLLPEPLAQRGIMPGSIGELAAGAASDSSGLCANFSDCAQSTNRLDRASPWMVGVTPWARNWRGGPTVSVQLSRLAQLGLGFSDQVTLLSLRTRAISGTC